MKPHDEKLEAWIAEQVDERMRIIRDLILNRVAITRRQIELREIVNRRSVCEALQRIEADALAEWSGADDDDWWRDDV